MTLGQINHKIGFEIHVQKPNEPFYYMCQKLRKSCLFRLSNLMQIDQWHEKSIGTCLIRPT